MRFPILAVLACSAALSVPSTSAQYGVFNLFAGTPTMAPAESRAMSRAYSGVALRDAGPSGFLLNPAHAAYAEPGVALTTSLASPYFGKSPYLSGDGIVGSNQILNAGAARGAWRIGAGFSRSRYGFGRQEALTLTDAGGNEIGQIPAGEEYQSSYVLSLGIARTGRFSGALGVSARRSAYGTPQFLDEYAGWNADLGMTASYQVVPSTPDGFDLTVGIGYARLGMGGEARGVVRFSDLPARTPLATPVRAGWSLTVGREGAFKGQSLRLFDLSVALEASAVVTEFEATEEGPLERSANPLLGPVRPLDALLGRGRAPAGLFSTQDEPEEAYRAPVTGYRSLRLRALEAVEASVGMHTDAFEGPDGFTTWAFGGGVSASGLVQSGLFGRPSPALSRLVERGDLALHFAYYDAWEDREGDTGFDYNDPWMLGATLSVAWP